MNTFLTAREAYEKSLIGREQGMKKEMELVCEKIKDAILSGKMSLTYTYIEYESTVEKLTLLGYSIEKHSAPNLNLKLYTISWDMRKDTWRR